MDQTRKTFYEQELTELLASLHLEEEPFLNILNAMGDGVSVQDRNLRILYTNEKYQRWFGEDLVGRYCYEIYEHRSSECPKCPVRVAYETGRSDRQIHSGTDAKGNPIVAEIMAAPIRNLTGEIVAGVEIVRDISEQVKAQEELVEKSRRLERLVEVSKDISSGLDLSFILCQVAENAARMSGADGSTVAILDEGRHVITYPFHFNMPDVLTFVEVPEGAGIAGEVMKTGASVLLQDYPKHPQSVKGFVDAGVKAILAVPLMIGSRRVGALGLFGLTAGKKFTPEDVEISIAIANQAAVAIDNAHLFDETRERLRVQKELTEAAISITSELEADKVMQRAVDHAASLVRCEAAMVALLDKERDIIRFPYAVNMPPELKQITSPRGQGVAGKVIESCRSLIVDDYQTDPNRRPEFVEMGFRAVATVPLTVGGSCIGAIGVMDTSAQRRFTTDDTDILSILSTQAATALDNARLYQELQDFAQMLEQRVKERTEALSRMYKESERKSRELEEANLKLREVDRLKSEFLANMSHELRTPLNSIIGFSKLILDGLDGDVNEEQQRDLDIVHRNGHELLRLIDDLLNLAKIEAGRVMLALSDTDVGDLVSDVVISLGAMAAEKGLALKQEIPGGLQPIKADPAKVRQVLFNLIGNAIKFTDAGTIQVTIEQTPEETLFSVSDTGIGLEPEETAAVFDRFHQVTPGMANSGSGVGLGLTISRRFVEMHGGRIWIESEQGQGSTFYFTIPGGSKSESVAS